MHIRRRIHRGLFYTAAALLCIVISNHTRAFGSGTTSTFWHIQNTGFTANGGSAVAMRDGGAWPIIFDSYGYAYSLFSTEGPNPGSNWHQIASGLYAGDDYLQVATSSDGHIAVLADMTSITPGTVRNPDGSWSTIPRGTQTIAYDNESNLLSSQFDGIVIGFNPPEGINDIGQIAVSRFGDIGFLATPNELYEYNHLLNDWHSSSVAGVLGDHHLMDFAYDSLGRPHLLGALWDGSVVGAYYDIRSAGWITETIMYGNPILDESNYIMLATNDAGVVGTAFVRQGNLYYAFKDNNEDWAVNLVDTGVDIRRQVGITYDYEGLPLISYSKYNLLHLAYDPIITIEPGLPGDLDRDGFVGLSDLDIILTHWNQNVAVGSAADPSLDGFVGLDDLDLVLENWNAGTPPADSVIPEPSTLAILILGALAAINRHKTRIA